MSGIFGNHDSHIFAGSGIFDGIEGVDGVGSSEGMGALPPGALTIAHLAPMRADYPRLPSPQDLSQKGVTHFTYSPGPEATFTFLTPDGTTAVGPMTMTQGFGPKVSSPGQKDSEPAHTSEGLLPAGPSASSREPRWLPWLLLGGGVVVVCGMLWASKRKKVRPNRRRRTSRR